MNLTKIESAVRAAGGIWTQYFRREGEHWQCILLPSERLTPSQYAALSRRFTPLPTEMDKAKARARAAAERHG